MFENRQRTLEGDSASQTAARSERKSRAKQRIGWLKFEEQFRSRYPSYLHDLARNFPTLSRTELQICAMLRESLLSWEIADMLYISERSVENHRCNIRKKLALASRQKLQSFLIGL